MGTNDLDYGTFENNWGSCESLGLLEQDDHSGKATSSASDSGHELSYSFPSVTSLSSVRRTASRPAYLFFYIVSLISDIGILSILLCVQLVIVALFALSMVSPGSVWDSIMKHLLSCAIFGIACGLTNWCAVAMLFREVPALCGSGVFSKHYKEICYSIKETLMLLVFDKPFLEKYLTRKVCQTLAELDVEKSIERLLHSDTFDLLLEEKITYLHNTPEGHVLESIGMDHDTIKSFIKPMILDIGVDVAMALASAVTNDEKLLAVDYFQEELDMYMLVCLDSVSKQLVTQHMQLVLRKHLSWIIFWGTVFGGIIGLIAGLAGVAPNV